MNHDAANDSILSDSSNDGEANTSARESENYALLSHDNEKSSDIILRRIAHYTDGGGSRFHKRKFQDDDGDDDDNDDADEDHRQFNVSLRQTHKKPVKRFLFLFGFAFTLIVLSQLYLLFYYDDPSVQGEF